MALNVNRSVTDPFYRYKMPRLQAKVEGKGNGIKTVIANMTEIAKSLERPATYPTKYFGCELGAQTNVDTKNERYIVNGDHDADKLQNILDGFIKKFVLCPACENPETKLTVKRNQINSKCKACGHAFIIDPKHKLSTYIIKNPPKIEVDYSAVVAKKQAAKENAAIEGLEDRELENSSSEGDDEGDWAEPTEEEKKLSAGIGKLVIDKDLEKSTEERLNMLHEFFEKAKKENTVGDGKSLADEAERLDVKQKAPLLLTHSLLDENVIAEEQFKKFRKVFLRFTLNDKKAQRYLLGGIEQLIVTHEEALLPKAPHILKALYDEDIVEEEAILAWADKPTSKHVSKTQAKKIIEKCEKVITWLREAEEDSEEDEEDEEIEFDERARNTGAYIEKAKAEAAKAAKQEEIKVANDDGEEIDIDDI